MRVLQIHNRYRAEGGEERAIADITSLLRRHGHEVHCLERSSEQVTRVGAARGLLRGGLAPEEVGRAVLRTGAEVVHAHNLHPLFGWRALAEARAAGARTILHLHNFRLFCAIAVAYRDGGVCFRCRGANTLPGLVLRCRGSLPEAAAYAAGLSRQQARLFEHADRFVAVSAATLTRLRELGLPGDNASTLPNCVLQEGFAESSLAAQGTHALAAGRLVEEKGFDTAIAAAAAGAVPLVVAGEGPDEARLRDLARRAGAQVTFTGRVSQPRLAELRSAAAVVLAPSRWEEPCPYAVLDAMAAGVPVLASDRGGLPELVGPELALPANDEQAWTQALAELWRSPELRAQRGAAALARARAGHHEDIYHERLMAVYAAA